MPPDAQKMAINLFLGFLDDQRAIEERLIALNITRTQMMYAPGILREDRFKLNNLSFAGPVIMGIGGAFIVDRHRYTASACSSQLPGFLIVASCVMTFESRDNAAKVVPSALVSMPSTEDKNRLKVSLGNKCAPYYVEFGALVIYGTNPYDILSINTQCLTGP